MEPFIQLEGIAASMPRPNIDTDAVIPAPYQRSLSTDMGKGLFACWRYDLDGNEIPEFILNQEPFRNSQILVAGVNFGCGSSREAAVWAIMQFGIRCVIAPSFSDIFSENSFKNGLLPIVLPEADVDALQQHLALTNDPTLRIDLQHCLIKLADGKTIEFTLPAARRAALLEGLDEIASSLRYDDDIGRYQDCARATMPWVYAGALKTTS